MLLLWLLRKDRTITTTANMTPLGGQCSCTSSTPSINSNSAAVSSSPSPGHADNRLFFTESPMLLPKERYLYNPTDSVFNSENRGKIKKSADFDPDITILNKGNFTFPKHGEKPDHCGKQHLVGIDKGGSKGATQYHVCKTARCPQCGDMWIQKKVFNAAVKVEAYAYANNTRPFRYVASIATSEDITQELTLADVRRLRDNARDRLKRKTKNTKGEYVNGLDAGLTLHHPFRIKRRVVSTLKRYLKTTSNDSAAFWNTLQNDPESIKYINTALGNGMMQFRTWRDCVKMSHHLHGLGFPGERKLNGDSRISLVKLTGGRDKHTGQPKKQYTLDTAEDVVKHLSYLMGHAGILIQAGKHQLQPLTYFGGLSRLDPADIVDSDTLTVIRKEVLAVMNQNRNNGFKLGVNGELEPAFPVPDRPPMHVIPLHVLASRSRENYAKTIIWINGIADKQHRLYCMRLCEYYRSVRDDTTRKKRYRKPYVDEAPPPPEGFGFVQISDIDEIVETVE